MWVYSTRRRPKTKPVSLIHDLSKQCDDDNSSKSALTLVATLAPVISRCAALSPPTSASTLSVALDRTSHSRLLHYFRRRSRARLFILLNINLALRTPSRLRSELVSLPHGLRLAIVTLRLRWLPLPCARHLAERHSVRVERCCLRGCP